MEDWIQDAENKITFFKLTLKPKQIKKALLKLVSRDRAIIDLLRLEQGTYSLIDLLSEVKDQEHLCRTEEMPLASANMERMRMSLIGGMKDCTLADKAGGHAGQAQNYVHKGNYSGRSASSKEETKNKCRR